MYVERSSILTSRSTLVHEESSPRLGSTSAASAVRSFMALRSVGATAVLA